MKKKLCAVILLCTVLLCFSCRKKDADNSLAAVLEKGVFVLGLDDSFPPMGFRDENNAVVGYDIDLAAAVCAKLGVELKVQPIDWAAKEQELATGQIDCIWNGFTMTPEREASLCFSKPYLDNAQVVFVRADSGIETLADLAGKKVGLQAASSAADALDANAELKKSLKEVVEFKDNLTAFMDLEIKGIDGVVVDMVVGNYSVQTSGKPFVMLRETLSSEKYGIGFRKNDSALRDAVQQALEELAADGIIAAISTKWFGADISVIGK
ncbi:MAG: amino acid ABC transporter substrate-binding protein [Bacteroides sp.]|nr:amino acid ABC transporter substrate-binding protein [Prevotella sp.]MCM1406990.1 amino acid ABC transporter substrate-binding protein [Treponema brennaborense]MCM1470141.1 amino acid ABC transporter substrate-binding protein [Bacteroides sp.]